MSSDTTEVIAGKLNVLSFDRQNKKVYLVPVNNAKTPTPETLKNALNRIYAQTVTDLQIYI